MTLLSSDGTASVALYSNYAPRCEHTVQASSVLSDVEGATETFQSDAR